MNMREAPLSRRERATGEEAVDLVPGQGSRRLIHDEDLGVQRDGLRDFDDLLVRDRQAVGQLGGVDRHFEAVKELLASRLMAA